MILLHSICLPHSNLIRGLRILTTVQLPVAVVSKETPRIGESFSERSTCSVPRNRHAAVGLSSWAYPSSALSAALTCIYRTSSAFACIVRGFILLPPHSLSGACPPVTLQVTKKELGSSRGAPSARRQDGCAQQAPRWAADRRVRRGKSHLELNQARWAAGRSAHGTAYFPSHCQNSHIIQHS